MAVARWRTAPRKKTPKSLSARRSDSALLTNKDSCGSLCFFCAHVGRTRKKPLHCCKGLICLEFLAPRPGLEPGTYGLTGTPSFEGCSCLEKESLRRVSKNLIKNNDLKNLCPRFLGKVTCVSQRSGCASGSQVVARKVRSGSTSPGVKAPGCAFWTLRP